VAHSKNDEGQSEPLAIHLSKTAQLAEQYADAFHEGVAGAWAGWFHDAGKASALFQDVLRGTEHRVNHAAAGAAMLYNVNMQIARAVYGHHDGLIWSIRPDLERSKAGIDDHDSQEGKRFAVFGKEQYYTAVSFMHSIHNLPKEPPKLHTDAVSGFSALPEMLHTRMLLSCLCDADYTATASHYDPSVWENTEEKTLDAPAVLNALTDYRKKLKETSTADPKLNAVRDSVYQSCLDAADHAPGMFTLTAPTGTGKTLALLAFAARHAHIHHKRRIIIVLPFLSIVSQNAAIYRKICGEVLESHSMISYGEKDAVRQLADQWNAPVVVTTSVKFFEVFFKYKPSDLRFLHSIANSVIVFDEAQSIPRELTGTTLETMRCLCETFRCTVLFSTATQPAFDIRKDVQYTPYEILHAPEMIYAQTKRVSVDWRTDVPVQLDHIAAEMAEHESVCCVLNRKDHTHKLFELLREICPHDECYHISTDMCKAHRDAVLHTITERLKQQLPCRLVSTSCIEAGVDLDFAVMYRALAPLEAIVQCAGRCNRNGKGRGSMTVFIPDKPRLY
ncbi:MAG: CRISPR-associated helicase Cas3', partial [Oscillospiraceae bacterium]|nr:CRISPR-associated helicase Cas3' [Oscillospiraceae bacterium]